jgi:hypothetical protein
MLPSPNEHGVGVHHKASRHTCSNVQQSCSAPRHPKQVDRTWRQDFRAPDLPDGPGKFNASRAFSWASWQRKVSDHLTDDEILLAPRAVGVHGIFHLNHLTTMSCFAPWGHDGGVQPNTNNWPSKLRRSCPDRPSRRAAEIGQTCRIQQVINVEQEKIV